MFHFFSIIIFLASLLYGAWSFFGDTDQIPTKNSIGYQEYLQQALERNTQTYNVSFSRSDFSDEDITSRPQDPSTNMPHFRPIDQNKEIIVKHETVKTGNFGTPPTSNARNESECTGGLIYDPCLVVGDPIRASGDLYFGS